MYKIRKLLLIVIAINLASFSNLFAQQLNAKEKVLDIGTVESALQLVYEFTIFNNSDKLNFILKVDGPKSCSIQIEKKKLLPKDSSAIIITYQVLRIGAFSEDIFIYSGNNDNPLTLTIKGKIKNVAVDDLQACHPTVKNRKQNKLLPPEKTINISGFVFDEETKEPINGADLKIELPNKIIDLTSDKSGLFQIEAPQCILKISVSANNFISKNVSINTSKTNSVIEIPLQKIVKIVNEPTIVSKETIRNLEPATINDSKLSNKEYAPNQIVFLIDKSASMKEPNKLPALKVAIKCILKELRSCDYLSVIYYSTTANILFENIKATDIEIIEKAIDTLKAKGQTSGGKGIALAYEIARKNYINNGNNEIILATDGAFKLKDEDKTMMNLEPNKTLSMSILAFGGEKKDLWQLYKLSLDAKGSYLQVNANKNVCNVLMEEIKTKSRIKR